MKRLVVGTHDVVGLPLVGDELRELIGGVDADLVVSRPLPEATVAHALVEQAPGGVGPVRIDPRQRAPQSHELWTLDEVPRHVIGRPDVLRRVEEEPYACGGQPLVDQEDTIDHRCAEGMLGILVRGTVAQETEDLHGCARAIGAGMGWAIVARLASPSPSPSACQDSRDPNGWARRPSAG